MAEAARATTRRAGEPSDNEADAASDSDCPEPSMPPVDPEADESARCLAGQFDQWADGAVMAVGQQVNLDDDAWTEPINALAPSDVRIIGFDLKELATAAALGKDRVPDLITLGEQGHVLVATWHADNPFSGQPSWDMTDTDKVAELTDPAGGGAGLRQVLVRLGRDHRHRRSAARCGRADHPSSAARGQRPVVLVGSPGP